MKRVCLDSAWRGLGLEPWSRRLPLLLMMSREVLRLEKQAIRQPESICLALQLLLQLLLQRLAQALLVLVWVSQRPERLAQVLLV